MILEKQSTEAMPVSESTNGPKKGRCPFLHGDGDVMKLMNFTSGKQNLDTMHSFSKPIKCTPGVCKGALMAGQSLARTDHSPLPKAEILQQADEFLTQYFASMKESSPEEFQNRMNEVSDEIDKRGTYSLTLDELKFGTKLAWRNASRCIGRIQWNKLEVQDCRNITTADEMFVALCKHLEYATNNGNLRSMITVFPQRTPGQEDFRLWNPQLLNFAGYLQPDGSIIGDPGRLHFTRICQRLGWKGKGGRFDILPWVMSVPGEDKPKCFDIPEELILRVHLEHPKYPWFAEMNINWYAVPAVADMLLDVGGLEFPACPFNGWYMGTEIGARNLCDPQRYNITKEVAEKMGLDTSSPISLWKDTVLVEVNIAVLYSFQKSCVTIVDHHTASDTFMKHFQTEQKLRGGCPADWVWIVPPISGSITPVFHQEMICYNMKPSYEYQTKAWLTYKWEKNNEVQLKYSFSAVAKAVLWCVNMSKKVSTNRISATIVFATETGKSETFAHRLESLLRASFNVKVLCMEDYDISDLSNEALFVVVASTFGSGEPPDNGRSFWTSLKKLRERENVSLQNLKYSVFGLGSSQYPMFCNFGKNVDKTLSDLGGHRIMEVALGDELRGQEHSFNEWVHQLYKASCVACKLAISADAVLPEMDALRSWSPENFRLTVVPQAEENIFFGLSKLHVKKLFPLRMLSRAKLQACYSDKQTLLVRLDTKDASALSYKPGDHVGVFPANPSSIVKYIIKRLQESGNTTDSPVQVDNLAGKSWKAVGRLPVATIETCLRRYLDITSPPAPHLLGLLSEMAKSPWDKFRLKRLSQVTDEFEEWKAFRYPNLQELLEEFPSVQLDPCLLLSELPLLQPRYYSISSAHVVNPKEVHITLTLVTFRTQDNKGPIHHGVCTSYLDSFPEEDVPCFIRTASNFRLPEDPSVPVIMVGAGSGIAPFRSFWQQREYLVKQHKLRMTKDESIKSPLFGQMVLFFGCRQPRVDNIYEQETAPLVRKGVLSKVFTAFSREEGKPKRYVQDEVRKQSKLVRSLIEVGGHVYVCGDAVMAADVRAAVESTLYDDSVPTLNVGSLMELGRYHEDVFGVLHRR